jgi:hypothetical protein
MRTCPPLLKEMNRCMFPMAVQGFTLLEEYSPVSASARNCLNALKWLRNRLGLLPVTTGIPVDGSDCQVVDGHCSMHHGIKPETFEKDQTNNMGDDDTMYNRDPNERDADTMMDNVTGTPNITSGVVSGALSKNSVARNGLDQQLRDPLSIPQSNELPSAGSLEFFDQDSMQDLGWLDSIPFDFHFYSHDQNVVPEFGNQRTPSGEQWNGPGLWQ